MTKQHQIEELKRRLRSIRTHRAMLETSALPDHRDRELRSRIAETETHESVVVDRLARLGVCQEIQEPVSQELAVFLSSTLASS